LFKAIGFFQVLPGTLLSAYNEHLLMNVLRTPVNRGLGKYFYNSGIAATTLYPASTHTACSRQPAAFDCGTGNSFANS
jgi:hypothetical protein